VELLGVPSAAHAREVPALLALSHATAHALRGVHRQPHAVPAKGAGEAGAAVSVQRFFEVVTKDGACVDPSELPDRDKGLLWHDSWKKLGFKKESVLFELISSRKVKGGVELKWACPGPFFIAFVRPSGRLGMVLDKVLDAAESGHGAVKLVRDGPMAGIVQHPDMRFLN
jgi:hypothetical protein